MARKRPSKREANFIGTPHLGEANDLVDDTKMNRFELLSKLQKKFDGDWVLKTHYTIPYGKDTVAKIALRCDERGCVAVPSKAVASQN